MANRRLSICFLAFLILVANGRDFRKKHGNKQKESEKIEYREHGECPLRRQSPVNFDFDEMISAKLPPLVWSREYNRVPDSVLAENNAETVKLTFKFKDGQVPILSGGPLLHRYRFSQLHFHWGTDNDFGSEHTIQGTTFPLEIHAVHVREDLTDQEATEYFDGMAVVAYFATIEMNGNPVFKAIADQSQIIKKAKSTMIKARYPLSTILPQFDCGYLTYSGSLTTEPYSEAVTWIVSNEKVFISQKQLDQLRNIASIYPAMTNNFREVNPLNGRVVMFDVC